jgi:hypothetical protein
MNNTNHMPNVGNNPAFKNKIHNLLRILQYQLKHINQSFRNAEMQQRPDHMDFLRGQREATEKEIDHVQLLLKQEKQLNSN